MWRDGRPRVLMEAPASAAPYLQGREFFEKFTSQQCIRPREPQGEPMWSDGRPSVLLGAPASDHTYRGGSFLKNTAPSSVRPREPPGGINAW